VRRDIGPMRIVQANASWLTVASAAGLTYQASTSASDGVLEQFFAAYDNAFVLPNEKEGLSGFADCLALNWGRHYHRLVGQFGPFREFVVLVRGAGATVVGGLNFVAFPLHDPDGGEPLLSLNLNYIFVQPAHRRRGLLKTLIGDLPALVLALFAHTNPGDMPAAAGSLRAQLPVHIFIEQNDPYRMGGEDYERDTAATGLDQLARIALWARQGAKVIDFPYVQPALTADQQADHNLAYAVLGTKTPTLHPSLLRQHLERFFAISVLKGCTLEGNAEADAQLVQLARLAAAGTRVRLFEIADPAKLPKPATAASAGGVVTLRSVLTAL